MKRILVLMVLGTVGVAGCGGGGERAEPVAVPSLVAATAGLGTSPDWAGCELARSLNAASGIGDFGAAGVALSKALDGPLAESGIRLAVESARPLASRSAVYRAYLDALDECLRVSP